jgi:hypothetical protein
MGVFSMDNEPEKSSRFKILRKKEAKKSDFVATIIVNIIFFYIVNNLLNWNISFIAPSFQNVLWIINLSIAATILANLIFLFYNPGWFRSALQIILNIIAFYGAYLLYTVFPFVFSNYYYTYGMEILLILAMIGTVIATIVEILRLILGRSTD